MGREDWVGWMGGGGEEGGVGLASNQRNMVTMTVMIRMGLGASMTAHPCCHPSAAGSIGMLKAHLWLPSCIITQGSQANRGPSAVHQRILHRKPLPLVQSAQPSDPRTVAWAAWDLCGRWGGGYEEPGSVMVARTVLSDNINVQRSRKNKHQHKYKYTTTTPHIY